MFVTLYDKYHYPLAKNNQKFLQNINCNKNPTFNYIKMC